MILFKLIYFSFRITEALVKADDHLLIPGKDGYSIYIST